MKCLATSSLPIHKRKKAQKIGRFQKEVINRARKIKKPPKNFIRSNSLMSCPLNQVMTKVTSKTLWPKKRVLLIMVSPKTKMPMTTRSRCLASVVQIKLMTIRLRRRSKRLVIVIAKMKILTMLKRSGG